MFPELDSVKQARKDYRAAQNALHLSMERRFDYIKAMHNRVGDDELRHIHYDCMDAHHKNITAHNRVLGHRDYQLID